MRAIILFLFSLFSFSFCHAQIFINEFMADNDSAYADEYGEFNDWIELYNAGATSVDVGGYFITDDLTVPTKYQIPSGNDSTMIAAGGYLLLWADEDLEQGVLHIDIKLGKGGEEIGLFAADTSLIDTITFGQQITDESYERATDGGSPWQFTTQPTPNASNSTAGIGDPIAIFPLRMYPNPAKDWVSFTESIDVELFDIQGRKILTAQNIERLNVSTLTPGMYLLLTNKQQRGKLIVE